MKKEYTVEVALRVLVPVKADDAHTAQIIAKDRAEMSAAFGGKLHVLEVQAGNLEEKREA
ncbi:hypothetical protein [Desulfovibrio psychrotolerans]|uniref:Uncharacterized protein n=1 Tax=Desulfovibrio psychrotolerans TaxID=415242 RepID=A0A7J0BYQ0_9BACT|nr:hypothetical protein [Desulfovibrio psychrotolerans]GFM38281.1 hypothetical protein DSM19430T_29650 [Desulfovibrio psychrotolerans]